MAERKKLEDDPILMEAIKIIPKQDMVYFMKLPVNKRETMLVLHRPPKLYTDLILQFAKTNK